VLDGVPVHYHRALPLNRYGISPGLFWHLPGAVRRADLVHCHGTAQVSTSVAALFARILGTALVVSPRGSLMRWARERKARRKAAYGALDAFAFRGAVFHATSEQEAEDIRSLGFRAFVVPNAADVEAFSLPVKTDWRRRLDLGRSSTLVTWFGRFDPVKNLEALVEAVAGQDLQLVLAGNAEGSYADRIRALVEARGVRCHFVGYQDGEAKRALLQQSDVVAAPSHMESYGMSVVEALAAGCAVVASTGTPWKSLDQAGAGRWVAPTAEGVRAGILEVLAIPPHHRRDMALALARQHGWAARAEDMIGQYRQVLLAGHQSR
jgi:glycosyltransferase involved in cell wall biosynthesis